MRVAAEIKGVKEGHAFGQRRVLGCAFVLRNANGSPTWNFVVQCECGKVSVVNVQSVLDGTSKGCKSCAIGKQKATHGQYVGGKPTSLFLRWRNMIARCTKPCDQAYENYGGRGIAVCDEWRAFAGFQTWAVASGFREELTLERKDCNGNYEPANCCWILPEEQARNKRVTRFLECHGQRKPVWQWSKETGVKATVIKQRLKRGWTPELAISAEAHA